MSCDVVIRLSNVGKAFPMLDKPYQALAHVLMPGWRSAREFHALQNVTLEMRRGEAIGVIGRNGSGKSTMLQIIAGILRPSTGRVEVNARIAALLELGAGFNPEFTGRENIHLNGSVLGLSAQQIAERFDAIVAFAEIGGHLDAQVKTYSSGMFLRLAFAVAVHTDPEVLIVDEALSVGDIYFQRKCFKRIEELRERGCTLLFVTHAVDTVLQLCDRGVVLDSGRLIFDGEARPAVAEYLKVVFGSHQPVVDSSGSAALPAVQEVEDHSASGTNVLAVFMGGGAFDVFHTRSGYNSDETRLGSGAAVTCDFLVESRLGFAPMVPAREPFRVRVRYASRIALDRLIFGIRICAVTGQVLYSSNTLVSTGELFACSAGSVMFGEFDLRCALLKGSYFVTLGVSQLDSDGETIHALDRRADSLVLTVVGESNHAEGLADLEAAFAVHGIEGQLSATPR